MNTEEVNAFSQGILKFPGEKAELTAEKADQVIYEWVQENSLEKAELQGQHIRYANAIGSKERNYKNIDLTEIITDMLYLGSCPRHREEWWKEIFGDFNHLITVVNPFALGDYSGHNPKQVRLSPSNGEEITFGEITVKTVSEEVIEMHSDGSKNPYEIKTKFIEIIWGKNTHCMVHTEFFIADHEGVPLNVFTAYVEYLSKMIRKGDKALFHCSAGKGRSATCLAGLLLKNLPREEFDLFDIVSTIRKYRMADCINSNQFELLWSYNQTLIPKEE